MRAHIHTTAPSVCTHAVINNKRSERENIGAAINNKANERAVIYNSGVAINNMVHERTAINNRMPA